MSQVDQGGDSAEGVAGEEKNLVSVFELELGACVNDQNTPEGEDPYPGTDYLISEGGSRCQGAFGDFIGVEFTESVLDFTYYYPTPSSWVDGDRSIYCLAVDPGLQITGSLLGARR